MPASSYATSLDWAGASPSGGHLLWIGSPSSIPAGTWRLADHVGYAVTSVGSISYENVFAPVHAAPARAAFEGLMRAAQFETTNLGQYLQRANIQYLAYPATGLNPGVRDLILAVSRQTDVAQVLTDPSVGGFRVVGFRPVAPSVPSGAVRFWPLMVGIASVLMWLALVDIVFFRAFLVSRWVTRLKVSVALERDIRAQAAMASSDKVAPGRAKSASRGK